MSVRNPIRALLAGKVLGNTVLAMGKIILLAGAILIGLQVSGGSDLFTAEVITKIGTALAWFIPFFLAGFLVLAGLWAVGGGRRAGCHAGADVCWQHCSLGADGFAGVGRADGDRARGRVHFSPGLVG